jgi:2'-5' RNA ligase
MEAVAASTLFFALPVPEEVRALAGGVQGQVRRAVGLARCPAVEGLHVTLAFLGRNDLDRLPELLRVASAAAAGVAGFTLRISGVGGFPRPGRARILWLGFAPQPALGALAERLRGALEAAGVAFDPKPFQPHLTLARFREPVDLGQIPVPELAPVAFEVAGFGLWQSVPTPQGSRYRPLGTVALCG